MDKTFKCEKCGNEIVYNESMDKQNNELIPVKMRKMIIDSDGNSAPLFALPKDKQRLVDIKFIKMICFECIPKIRK